MTVEKKAMAYLLVNRDGRVIDLGGNLLRYGLEELRPGQLVAQNLVCLEGLLPLGLDQIVLASVSLLPGLHADIHLFSRDEGDWVLLLDVTAESEKLQQLYQKVNESCLLQDRLAQCERELEAARAKTSPHH